MDAPTATAPSGCTETAEPAAPPASQPQPQPQRRDHTALYHDMIVRALVDWGDDIVDTLCAKFQSDPKTVELIEAVRREKIDPLRPSRA